MSNPLSAMRAALARRRDPLRRELEAMQQARDEGIARKLDRLNRALREADEPAILRCQEETEHFLQVVEATSSLPARLQAAPVRLQPAPAREALPPPAIPTYWVGSTTLAQAHAYLTQRLPGTHQEPEWMLAVSGLQRDHLRTLEQLIEVRLATQSAGQASFDMQDFTRIAVALHEHGQALHAIFHSHRCRGAPHPSGTDDRLQHLLEEGGYPAIQAVFSEDGYVRFFARRRPFAVEVHGKGVEQIDDCLYRILHFGALPHPAPAAQDAARGHGPRSLPARAGR